MKRIKILFGTLLILMLGVFCIQSCENEPPIPACERDKVGTVDVINSTGYRIKTDVTWGSVTNNNEMWLNNRASYLYRDIPAGGIEIWIKFDGGSWAYDYENLSVCENLKFTWYLDARKSVNDCPFLLDIGNGQLVKPKLKDKY